MEKQIKSSGCNSDLKQFMCLAGARPCEVDAKVSKRSSAPCEWCTKMVAGTANGKTNACSSPEYPFDFKGNVVRTVRLCCFVLCNKTCTRLTLWRHSFIINVVVYMNIDRILRVGRRNFVL